MSDKDTPLRVFRRAPHVDRAIMDLAARVMDMAVRGELQFLAVVLIDRDNEVSDGHAYIKGTPVYAALGAMEMLKASFIARTFEGIGGDQG